jgi:hypothetical protein
MKTIVNNLLQGRIKRWVCLATLLAAIGASVGWMNQKHYQLGGGFIGGDGAGGLWNAVQIPLDPAGRTAAIRVVTTARDAGLTQLLAMFGIVADTFSDGVGEDQMISKDTAKWSMVAYAQKKGDDGGLQIVAILVYTGTWKFTGPDNTVLEMSLTVYPAAADADKDGFPDPGSTPLITIPGMVHTGKRVPIP